jgi:hypothetical protein
MLGRQNYVNLRRNTKQDDNIRGTQMLNRKADGARQVQHDRLLTFHCPVRTVGTKMYAHANYYHIDITPAKVGISPTNVGNFPTTAGILPTTVGALPTSGGISPTVGGALQQSEVHP